MYDKHTAQIAAIKMSSIISLSKIFITILIRNDRALVLTLFYKNVDYALSAIKKFNIEFLWKGSSKYK